MAACKDVSRDAPSVKVGIGFVGVGSAALTG